MSIALEKIKGSIYGGAVGDSMGGPIEPWVTDLDFIEKHFGTRRIETLYDYLDLDQKPEWYFGPAPKGTYTDDTIGKNIVCRSIIENNGRIGAREFAQTYYREMKVEYFTRTQGQLWPGQALVWYKMFFYVTGQPANEIITMPPYRDMGQGNLPACDAAMVISPIGLINAGDAFQAAMDAMEVSSVFQSGHQVTAAAAVAAAVAEAMKPKATLADVLHVAVEHTDEETARRIRLAIELAETSEDEEAFKRAFHEQLLTKQTDALEVVPEAFGILALTGGDYAKAIIEAVNFQRDVDTIAGIAGSICGALHGFEAIPSEWVKAVRDSNTDYPDLDDLCEGIYDALVARKEALGDHVECLASLLKSG